MTRQGLLGAATIGRPLFVTPLYACLLVQEETLDCMFDLAFRKFRPADAPFQLDLLELFPTACANVLAEPSVARYPAQKRAAIAMCEMAGVHSVWLFSKAGGRAEERLLKVPIRAYTLSTLFGMPPELAWQVFFKNSSVFPDLLGHGCICAASASISQVSYAQRRRVKTCHSAITFSLSRCH